MIFYFSGTGNSLDIAKKVAVHQGETMISIAKEMAKNENTYRYKLAEGERIIFVYPVYAWAAPKKVMDFIKHLEFVNYKNNYVSTIAVCAENVGNTIGVFKRALKVKGITLNSGFSVKMPNNYIIAGDVDLKEVQEKTLLEAEKTLAHINDILYNKVNGVFEIEKGLLPRLLTLVVNPLFKKYGTNTKPFSVDNNCIECGICEAVCNGKCIKLEGKPKWQGECTQCLACIHYCPKKAINYGKNTENKGRYKNPNVTIQEMKIID